MIPLVDLQRLHASLHDELSAATARALRSGRYLLGPETQALEREFAAHEGAAHGVCCGSGSDALFLALRALDVGPGDAVVTVSNSFLATAESVARTGAELLFAEPDERTCCLDPDDLRRLLDEPGAERIRVVLPVHLYGHPADIAGIERALRDAGREDVVIVGDSAQAHGSAGVGALTPVSCYSFYPSKNLGAVGDGGMVLCQDEQVAERLRSLRNHGRATKHSSGSIGLNSRFDDLQAAVLRAKLPHLRRWNAMRNTLAMRYRGLLSGDPRVRLPDWHPDHVYHLFVVRLTAGRDAVYEALQADGVGAGLHYPTAVHQMPPYPSARPLPVTERLCGEVLSLPIFPLMELSEVDTVVASLQRALAALPAS